MVIFLNNLYIFTFLGSIFKPCYIQNHFITESVLKKSVCSLHPFFNGRQDDNIESVFIQIWSTWKKKNRKIIASLWRRKFSLKNHPLKEKTLILVSSENDWASSPIQLHFTIDQLQSLGPHLLSLFQPISKLINLAREGLCRLPVLL